jgi:hypothetical protein
VVRIASRHFYSRHLEPLLQHHVSTQWLLLILLCVKSYLTLRWSAYNLTRFMITSRHVVDAVIPATVCFLKSDSILPPSVESLQLETYLLDARSTYSGQQYDTLTDGNTVDTRTSVLLPSSPTPMLPVELLNNIESCIQSYVKERLNLNMIRMIE